MAEDKKFKFEDGKFVNRISGEAIPDDEPVIIFRARDVHAIEVLLYYLKQCVDEHHRQVVLDRINDFKAFKTFNPGRMKEPGITHHMELHSCRLPIHIIIPENVKEEADEMSHEEDLHQGRRHESPVEERMDALENREHHLEKEMKNIMADIDILNGILSDIGNDSATLKDDFKNLEGELLAAQEAAANNQPIDLTSSILMARNAQAALDAIIQSAGTAGGATGGGATPPPPPPPPPPASDLTLGGSLPDATVGSAYTGSLSISGGTAPYSVTSSPPSDNGLTINTDGSVTGTPIAPAASTFLVTVTDSATPAVSFSTPVILNSVDAAA